MLAFLTLASVPKMYAFNALKNGMSRLMAPDVMQRIRTCNESSHFFRSFIERCLE